MGDAAAVVSAVGFVAIAAFQFALALGAPWGRAAWGGRAEGRLPSNLRIASGVAGVAWLFAAAIVLGRADLLSTGLPDGVVRWGSWALVGLLAIGTVMNLASRSRLERAIWTPVCAALTVATFLVASSPWPTT